MLNMRCRYNAYVMKSNNVTNTKWRKESWISGSGKYDKVRCRDGESLLYYHVTIRSVNRPGLCPSPFNESKMKLLKFFTSCWVQCKITDLTNGLNSVLNHWTEKCMKLVRMPQLYPGLFTKLNVNLFCFSCWWIRCKNTRQRSGRNQSKCQGCTPVVRQIKSQTVEVL